tara:strand:- start:4220 stop:5689 length:1470 start_codon:yes stop_codon:yes gene_type:complete
MRILLVDDEQNSRESVAEFLEELGHQVQQSDNAGTATRMFRQQSYPLVITDIRMPGMDGIEFLKVLKKSSEGQDSDIVVYTGHGDMETAVSSLRAGAYDYLQKPINVEELAHIVDKAVEKQRLRVENQRLTTQFKKSVAEATIQLESELISTRKDLAAMSGLQDFEASSKVMQELVRRCKIYHSDPNIPVLIEGETGTGKEMLARLIHFGEEGNSKPFVDINCASFSIELFESELFGYEAGAFTGGKSSGEKGKMSLAKDGSLFFDEIGDLPLALQPKLLRVLQDRTYFQVGGLQKIPFEARVISATNQNLEDSVSQNQFRRDLFYRLNVGYLYIPPLRERQDEIPILAKKFLLREANKKKKQFKTISNQAESKLLNHHWPGNIRQLENMIERAVLNFDHHTLLAEHLLESRKVESYRPTHNQQAEIHLPHLNQKLPNNGFQLEEWIDDIILEALKFNDGNKAKTARFLGISRTSLYSRLKRLKKITQK